MKRYFKDEGLIIKKTQLADEDLLLSIFSSGTGKITLRGYGVKKITSRRMAHLEVGNYIRFSYYQKSEWGTLGETELLWAHSKIKRSVGKVHMMFLLFFVLHKILPEGQQEEAVFKKIQNFLAILNNHETYTDADFHTILQDILVLSGFVSHEKVSDRAFDAITYTEGLIGFKLQPLFLVAES